MDRKDWIAFGRAMAAFFIVAGLWAGAMWLVASQFLNLDDQALPIALTFAGGLVWQGLVNMCAGVVRRLRGQSVTAWGYMIIAVIVSGVVAFFVDLFLSPNAGGAIVMALGAMVLGLVSAVIFASIAGLSWSRRV